MVAIPSSWGANLLCCPWATGQTVSILFQSIAYVMCTSTNILTISSAGTRVGTRPGTGDWTAATGSSEFAPVTVLSSLCFPFHKLLAYSNALDKHFLRFEVCWCLVSMLSCKKVRLHGHMTSELVKGTLLNSEGCSIMTICFSWIIRRWIYTRSYSGSKNCPNVWPFFKYLFITQC